MKRHSQKEIEQLKNQIIELGGFVEKHVECAVAAVIERDPAKAEKVIEGDRRIDSREVQIESECLKILALYQPVAMDLRLVVAVLKINGHLERIGDLAVNIARRAVRLCEVPNVEIPPQLKEMSLRAKTMVRESMDALAQMKAARAREVWLEDEGVDELNRFMHSWAAEEHKKNPSLSEGIILVLSASKHLERLADHASKIAEDVVFLLEGEIVRHGNKLPYS